MHNVSTFIKHLLIIGLTAGLGGLADAYANTSAEEVLEDVAADTLVDVTETVDAEAETIQEDEPSAIDEAATPAVEPPVNDYGDALLNQLYNE